MGQRALGPNAPLASSPGRAAKSNEGGVRFISNATNLAAVFDEHLRDEFELHDAPATMTTMSESPHVYHLLRSPTVTARIKCSNPPGTAT